MKKTKTAKKKNKVGRPKKVKKAPKQSKKAKKLPKQIKPANDVFIEHKEREYKFSELLVPYFLGGDTKEGNLTIREALIKLGKTKEMTDLFVAIKTGNLDYNEESTETFVKALISIIKGNNQSALQLIFEEDIAGIHANNLKTFNEYWQAKEVIPEELRELSN
jgi:hypothetical protein